jgi:hypothetical protein
MYSKIWYILYVLVLCTQVNRMFVMLLWVCIHTGKLKLTFASPRWESNPRPLGSLLKQVVIVLFVCVGCRFDSHRGQANFSACPVWMDTQSNITNIIFTWVHNTSTHKKYYNNLF